MGFKFNIFTGTLDLIEGENTTWLSPVATRASLPSGVFDGSAINVLDEESIFVYDSTSDKWHNTRLSLTQFNAAADAAGITIDSLQTGNVNDYRVNIHPATSTTPGAVSTSAQNFAGDKTFDNNVTVTGDFTVNGTTTTVNTSTLDVTDTNITINNGGSQSSADLNDAGLTVSMSDATDVVLGYDSTLTSRMKVGDLADEREIVTVSHSQTLTNKTIDGSSTGSNILNVQSINSEYDPTGDNVITATNVDGALGELDTQVNTNTNGISANTSDIADIRTTTGTSDGDINMGPFTGTTISDNVSTKVGMQELETAVEARIPTAEKGVANGVAGLDSSGIVPTSQLPPYQENIALIGNGTANWKSSTTGLVNSKSLLFDGVNEYCTTGGTPSSQLGSGITTAFTCATWIKTSVADGVWPIMGQWDIFNSNAKWALILNKSGGVPALRLATSSNGSSASVNDEVAGTLDSNTWVHVAVTYDGTANEVKHYVNGSQIGLTDVAPYASLFNSTFDFRLGSVVNGSGGNSVFQYYMDEPAVFNIALNAPQMTELFNSGSVYDYTTHSKSINLVGWWRMGDGDTFPNITDQLGFNNLTMTNMESIDIVSDSPLGSGGTTTALTLSNDCFLSVPPLANDRHTIPAQSISMIDGECAYVTIDRAATLLTNLPVTVDSITNVTPDNNKIIIARNASNECYFGLKDPQRISDGETIKIQKSSDESTFSAANNQTTAANVTGLAFDNSTIRSFEVQLSVVIDATINLYEVFNLRGIQRGSDWQMDQNSTGDTSNISFTITNTGQVQYTSGNEAGFVSSTMKFKATTTGI